MKINFIIPFFDLSGGLKIIFDYANRLKDRGYDVKIYAPVMPYDVYYKGFKGKLRKIKVIIKNLFVSKENYWYDLKVDLIKIPKVKDKYIDDADIIFATAWPTAEEVYKLSKQKGKKAYFIQDYEIWHGELDRVHNTYKLPMNQIVIAKWLKNLMKEKFERNDSTLIYNGLDFKELHNDNKSFDKEPKTVTMLYHHLESKGFVDGLKAIELVRQTHPNLKVNLFGAQDMKDKPDYVNFYLKPSRDKIRELYSESDAFLFTSRSEGWGLTPIEAMACKCAVVGTNVGAMKEIGIHRQNALLSEPENYKKLANNLNLILEDRDLREKISMNGFETVQEFAWDKSVDKFESFINNM